MRDTGQSSAQPTRTSADFALSGPSSHPNPAHNAYRKDLADVALAGVVIASHYAEPLERRFAREAELRSRPADDADSVATVEPGTAFLMLENSAGWAWGYAGPGRCVGYVRSEALA